MAIPFETECAIAHDLLVPYAAGDVSPETAAWLNAHLNRCPTCRKALDELLDATGAVRQQPAPPAPTAPGPRLVGRVRRNIIILITAVVLSVALAAGGIGFGVYQIMKVSGLTVEHPVPMPTTSAQSVINKLDLSTLHLVPDGDDTGKNFAGRSYHSDTGDLNVSVRATLSPSERQANQYFKAWYNSYGSRMLSVENVTPSHAVAKFRSQGKYMYGWQEGPWTLTMEVWGTADDLGAVRDQVRDLLFVAIRQTE